MGLLVVVVGIVLVLAMVPQMWVKRVISAHAHERDDFPGTGGEFARHILNEMKLHHVRVEETNLGDHYDPMDKTVRLKPENMRRRSLSAVVIAAHEVGHAMQDAAGYPPLAARTRMARQAGWVESLGSIVMLAAPVILLVGKSPVLMMILVAAGVVILGFTVLMHVVTLPVEFDASFGRALPVLEAGRYLRPADLIPARSILRAAALTYVASAAMSLLDVARWIRVLRP